MKNNLQFLKILVAEDDEQDYILFTEYLKSIPSFNFDVRRVEYDGWAEKLSGKHECLCFYSTVPGSKDGIEFLRSVSDHAPVILLSENKDDATELLAIKAGAYDFLVKKDLSEKKLEHSICYAMERMKQIKKLQESERKFKTHFEKFPDILFIADEQYIIEQVNYAVTHLLGYDEKNWSGKSLLSFFNDTTAAENFTTIIAANGEVQSFETSLVNAAGGITVCNISASIETNSNGNDYIQGMVKNVSVTQKAEKAFLQSEKHAASGRFISTLAHELRNPLNNIKLAVENLLPAAANEEDSFFLSIIQRNGERINNLVTELLNSSRPADVQFEDLSLHDLLNKVTGNLKDKFEKRNLKLSTHFDMVDAIIKADPVKLDTALSHIIENAMEAVKDDTGHIELRTVYHNSELTLLIKDNGPGISDDHKDKIFEPYFTSKRNGIGLGLSKALSILQSHNAKTDVYSSETEGTTFSIQFTAA